MWQKTQIHLKTKWIILLNCFDKSFNGIHLIVISFGRFFFFFLRQKGKGLGNQAVLSLKKKYIKSNHKNAMLCITEFIFTFTFSEFAGSLSWVYLFWCLSPCTFCANKWQMAKQCCSFEKTCRHMNSNSRQQHF